MKAKFTLSAMAALAVFPFVVGGCVLGDDDPDYVSPPSSTTIIDRDNDPDVHITPTPNVNIEQKSPPIIIEKSAPPVNIDIRTDPPVVLTTGGN